jgi:hypothetical protein
MAPVLRTALHLYVHAALYHTFDTSPVEIIRHFIVSNWLSNTSVSTATLIRSLKWGPQINLCVCLRSRFYEGPCHWFWGRIVLILFPIWPQSSLQSFERFAHNAEQHFLPLCKPRCASSIPNLVIHWSQAYTNQFTGTRDFSCSYTAACVRDRAPQACGEAHTCQDQIYEYNVCKMTVLCNLWQDSVDIFARPIMPLWLELYVLKCQVFRYFTLIVVEIMKNDVSFKNKTKLYKGR